MFKNSLPVAPEGRPCASVTSGVMPRAFDRWAPDVRAADSDDDRSISVYDVIGTDWWTGEGVTAKRVAAALRNMGAGPVTVNVNSPGGDMFEGLAIYNLLREHKGDVTVKVLGLAASSASIIAMAGDTIQIARAGFLMIHNGWVVVAGNRLELREIADWMEPFDKAMSDIYSARTGIDAPDIQKMMDSETWVGGADAVDQGFADELLASDQVGSGDTKANAHVMRRVEAAFRAAGLPRSASQRLLNEFKSSLSDSAGSGARDATGRSLSDSAVLSETAALAASLTTIIPKD